jgi:hypothetical protein
MSSSNAFKSIRGDTLGFAPVQGSSHPTPVCTPPQCARVISNYLYLRFQAISSICDNHLTDQSLPNLKRTSSLDGLTSKRSSMAILSWHHVATALGPHLWSVASEGQGKSLASWLPGRTLCRRKLHWKCLKAKSVKTIGRRRCIWGWNESMNFLLGKLTWGSCKGYGSSVSTWFSLQ